MRRILCKYCFHQGCGALAAVLLCLSLSRMVDAEPSHVVRESFRVARLPQIDASLAVPMPDSQIVASQELVLAPEPDAQEQVGGSYLVPQWLESISTERANASCDGQRWLNEFDARIQEDVSTYPAAQLDELPSDFRPWWDEPVRNPPMPALHVSIDKLIEGALQYSSYVRVVAAEPRIRRTAVVEELAAFDWRGFLETTYNDVNDPVGNILTTGTNENRYKDRTWNATGGVRRDNRYGGNVELSQQLGTQQNNSRFLLPNPQATTQLELRYTQPLLNGAGRPYNESRIVLASINADISSDNLIEDLEDHLIAVTESYWELYRARAEYFQRLRLLESAETTLAMLQAREGVDAVQRQVLRARAAVATRRSEIIRANTSIRNAQSQLRLLVNDPSLVQAANRMFAPVDPPLNAELPLAIDDSLYAALLYRPDISEAIREIRAASVRLGVAKNEILPKLDLVTSTYVAGLAARSDVPQSWGSQFDEGRPSFLVGMIFETPFGRRAARAQEERRQLEMQRAFSQFRLTVETTLTDVEIAVRTVRTNHREMVARYHAMVAVSDEADYLFDRWRTLPGADDSSVLLLENLLDAQERVADEEQAVVLAQVRYALSIVQLKKEMGTLMVVKRFDDDTAMR